MPLSLSQKKRNLWIEIAVLVGAGLLLKLLGFDMLAGLAFVIVAFAIPFQVIPLFTRTETAEEAAARQVEREQAQGKFAAIEQAAAESTDEKTRAKAETDLLWKYMRAWQKSNVLVPNALVEGWRARSVDIEDGDFQMLAKERDLKKAMMARDAKWANIFSKDIRRTEASVEKWRKGVEEIRAGTREGPPHFDAEDYLQRLNAAFPPPERLEASAREGMAREVTRAN